MAYSKRAYVEHAAIRVKDLDWHLRFFRDVLGMPVRMVDGPRTHRAKRGRWAACN